MEFMIRELPPYMDVTGIEENFSIGRRIIWKLLDDREIEGSQVGRRWKVKTKSILKYLEKRKNILKEGIDVSTTHDHGH